MATCYRHPKRETGVSCSNCGRPICTECMTPTSVGMRCPECARERTKVRTAQTIAHGDTPTVTTTLIVINVVLWVLSIATSGGGRIGGGWFIEHGALWGPGVHYAHEYWRLVSGGFLHNNVLPGGILHIGFNMYLLWILGRLLEPAIGRLRFGVLYGTSLLCGSLGALLLSWNEVTVGASGAVFGLMAASVIIMYARGVDPMRTGIPALIVINLIFSFTFSGISIGGHIGGLIGGAIAGWLLVRVGDRARTPWLPVVACVAIAVVAVVVSIGLTGSVATFNTNS